MSTMMNEPPIIDPADITLPAPARASLGDWLRLARPRQWIKNLVVFAGLLFTGRVAEPRDLLAVTWLFLIFCAISAAGYIVNDVLDCRLDQEHPTKRRRPIASGRIRVTPAIAVAVVLLISGMAGAVLLGWQVALVTGAYLAVTVAYSVVLKHRVIIDLLSIAAGFLLRALAGTACLGVELSPWLFVCLSFLSLMLGLGKRRHEIGLLNKDAVNHRPVLSQYSRSYIDQMLMMMAASSIITYAIYTINSHTAQQHPALVYTVPFVLYAIMRYVYLVQHFERGGQPEEIFLTDRPMGLIVILWSLAVMAIFLWNDIAAYFAG
ncbi:MAG: decaprenyl-phosphate phosphoribosyltransferase [Armatimonadota bacterium]